MRLLLAEDDPGLVSMLRKDLESAGYAVDVADNGVDAEFLGDEEIYDVAVLDLGLPGRNGIEVLNNWRARGNSIPVIVLTARNAWHERVEGFKAGADDYLGKPFHVEELLARLTALLHRASQKPGGSLKVFDLALDEDRQTVTTIDGIAHTLTGTEFRLLRYFLLNPGKVISKSELTDHIYDLDSDKDSNVIEVYVKRLRNLIGDHRIETRRGQGYVFRDS
ncbi:MAG: transcriptional regulator [Acidithiobacillales bacterium SG8_45]|jgi:two-component system OmpR family response regulator|nr:MAG: transcriptional regulator [Acidithiobacillales bacterium SG8_45]